MDINDLTLVLANFGKTYGASSAVNAVPEASSIALVAIGSVSVLAFAWRKHRAMGREEQTVAKRRAAMAMR